MTRAQNRQDLGFVWNYALRTWIAQGIRSVAQMDADTFARIQLMWSLKTHANSGRPCLQFTVAADQPTKTVPRVILARLIQWTLMPFAARKISVQKGATQQLATLTRVMSLRVRTSLKPSVYLTTVMDAMPHSSLGPKMSQRCVKAMMNHLAQKVVLV